MTDKLFSNESRFVFGAIKPKNHSRFLKGHICFDSPQERTQLWETDRFAAVREIWKTFNSNISRHVAPLEYLLIDVKLYPMRRQIDFRQYNRNKPHRQGLLLKSLNDARFPYTYKALPYATKPNVGEVLYYLKITIDYIKYLVTKMEADQPITGRTVSTDRLYTSIELTNWLLHRGITIVGRSVISSQLFDTQKRKIFCATLKLRRRTFALHLTPSRQSQKKRNMSLFYRPPDHCMAKKLMMFKNSPQVIKFYDFAKGRTDIVNQLNDCYTTRLNSCYWVMVALSCILDTARVNGKSVWCQKIDSDISSTSSYNFSWNLAKALALPHVQR